MAKIIIIFWDTFMMQNVSVNLNLYSRVFFFGATFSSNAPVVNIPKKKIVGHDHGHLLTFPV